MAQPDALIRASFASRMSMTVTMQVPTVGFEPTDREVSLAGRPGHPLSRRACIPVPPRRQVRRHRRLVLAARHRRASLGVGGLAVSPPHLLPSGAPFEQTVDLQQLKGAREPWVIFSLFRGPQARASVRTRVRPHISACLYFSYGHTGIECPFETR